MSRPTVSYSATGFCGPSLASADFAPSAALVLLSGHGGATVRKISLTHGRVLWESRQHDHHAGFLPDQGFTGADVTFVGASEGTESDVVVLTNAREVRRLDGRTGETVWKTSAATAQ